jgi:DNA-3-methyladenine glycosylase I
MMAMVAETPTRSLDRGPDGARRCWWALSSPEYVLYHDEEWGRPVLDDDGLFERLCLEAFQTGLSWLTILRKREAFRWAFAGFRIPEVAGFGPGDVERLLQNEGIVRNRQKIVAAIENAKSARKLSEGGHSLAELVWSHRPTRRRAPRSAADLPAETAESAALSKELKRRGFRFVGPTTAYALMQACGLVNDHVRGCHVRGAVERVQREAARTI